MPHSTADDARSRIMMRNVGKLSVLTLVSRILGLVREMTKAAILGTGTLGDAFTVAFLIPNFMRRLFAEGSVSVAFIPIFKGYLHDGNDADTKEFLSATLTMLTVCVGATVALGIALAPWIVKAFGSDPVETAALTRIMFPFLALVSYAALFQGILNSTGVFTPSGFAPILFNICFIVVPWLIGGLAGNPARSMAVAVVIGGMAQALCQIPAVLRGGFRFGFISPWRAFTNPGSRRVLALIAPTIIGMAAYQINDMVSTALASKAGTGVASSLQYSLRLQELILGIFAVSASTVLLPELADASRHADWKRFGARLSSSVESMVLATIPVAIFSMMCGREIVTLLFQAREFGEASVSMTTSVFFWHQTGLFFIAINRVAASAFYARSDSKTPTMAGVASMVVNVGMAVLLVRPMGGTGIALALTIASISNTCMLFLFLHRSGIESIHASLRAVLFYTLRILVISAAAAVPVLMLRPGILRLFSGASSRLTRAGLPLLLESLLFLLPMILLLILTRDHIAASILAAFSRKAGIRQK